MVTMAGGRKPPTLARAGRWECPRCHKTVQFFVRMSAPPSCHNHVGGAFAEMEWKGKE
jgi:hypothetical protein